MRAYGAVRLRDAQLSSIARRRSRTDKRRGAWRAVAGFAVASCVASAGSCARPIRRGFRALIASAGMPASASCWRIRYHRGGSLKLASWRAWPDRLREPVASVAARRPNSWSSCSRRVSSSANLDVSAREFAAAVADLLLDCRALDPQTRGRRSAVGNPTIRRRDDKEQRLRMADAQALLSRSGVHLAGRVGEPASRGIRVSRNANYCRVRRLAPADSRGAALIKGPAGRAELTVNPL